MRLSVHIQSQCEYTGHGADVITCFKGGFELPVVRAEPVLQHSSSLWLLRHMAPGVTCLHHVCDRGTRQLEDTLDLEDMEAQRELH